MGKIGDQRRIYKKPPPQASSQSTLRIDRFVCRPQSPDSGNLMNMEDPPDALPLVDSSLFTEKHSRQPKATDQSSMAALVTVEVLDLRLQTLLQSLTNNIAKEVSKLAHEFRGEIDHLGERTDTLETKFDDMVQYVHVLEYENATLKNAMMQLLMQQKDLKNRECRQNLWIRGVPESITDKEICPYLLTLFIYIAPDIPDIDWRLDRAHRSLAPKPPPGC